MDFDHLRYLHRSHPAWTLLRAEHAPMVIGFLHRTFIIPNVRSHPEQALAALLDDWLFHLRQRLDDASLPPAA